jgi:hypothetical protein
MYGLPTKIYRANGLNIQDQIQRTYQAIRANSANSGYSNHILNTGHTYGNITNTMKILKIEKKGKHLNTLEKYHIYKREKMDCK